MSKRGFEVVTQVGEDKYCYLHSTNTIAGGGSYLSRILEARERTKADVFVFVLPEGQDKEKIHKRIARTVRSLKKAVLPGDLPFRVAVSYANVFSI